MTILDVDFEGLIQFLDWLLASNMKSEKSFQIFYPHFSICRKRWLCSVFTYLFSLAYLKILLGCDLLYRHSPNLGPWTVLGFLKSVTAWLMVWRMSFNKCIQTAVFILQLVFFFFQPFLAEVASHSFHTQRASNTA